MAVESVGSVINNQTQAQALKQAGIGQDDFLKVLLAQLSFQDPLKPLDNQQFIAQMAQFTNLEQTRQSNDRLDLLLTIQSANQSIGLIGKQVEVRTDSSAPTVGTVTTVTFQNGLPNLTVKLAPVNVNDPPQFITDVTLSQVAVVRNVP